jgi:hypothetical protein
MGDLMHNLFGGVGTLSNNAAAQQNVALGTAYQSAERARTAGAKKVFHGNVEVLQVTNGFVVNIGTREGYAYETHIASSITEVNEIIAAQIVAFKLEERT